MRVSNPIRNPCVGQGRWILHRRSASCLQRAPHRICLQPRDKAGRDPRRAVPVPTGSKRANRFPGLSRFPRLIRVQFETGAPVFPGIEVVTKILAARGKLFFALPGDVNECRMSAMTLYRSHAAPGMNSVDSGECDAARFVRKGLAADRAFTESDPEPGQAQQRTLNPDEGERT